MKSALFLLLILSSQVFANSYVIELKKGFKRKDILRIKSYEGIKSFSKFTEFGGEYFQRLYSIETSNVKVLNKDSSIALIENDFKANYYEIRINKESKMIINDIQFPQQWGLYNQDQFIEKRALDGSKIYVYAKKEVDINWATAIDHVESNITRSPVVAVVDMGIEMGHPELKDAIYKNLAECDENGGILLEKKDRDGNHLPSDCHGWNFAATDKEFSFYPEDDKGHGTHVSGIIAAKRNNGKGIGGVSDKIKILPIRVTGMVDEIQSEKEKLLIKSPSKRIANGILYAASMNVDVINLSLGWPQSMDTKYMRKAIGEAIKKGITVVAAAGNDNSSASIYPCNYYEVICVGSIDIDGKVSAFSNHGGQVDILAPGDQIVSTIPTTFIPLKLNTQGTDIMSGTSQAAPFVSATAALIRASFPGITADEVKARLFGSSRPRLNITKSIGGLLNFKGAFEAQTKSIIRPVFKELYQQKVDPKNGIIKFPIYFKNYGKSQKNVAVQMASLNKGIEIINYTKGFSEIVTGKPTPIFVTARVKDFNANHSFNFKVKVNNIEYFHAITLGLDIKTIPKMEFGFRFSGKPKPIIVKDKKSGKYVSNLNTVNEKYEDGELPSYYLLRKIKKDKNQDIKVSLFNFDGKGFSEVEKVIEIKNALKFLKITKHDFNYDGKKDILLKTIACRETCDFNNIKEDDLLIKYSYRTMDLKPLFGKYSDIDFVSPDNINVASKTVRYYKHRLPNGMDMAAPYFIFEGRLPKDNKITIKLRDKKLGILVDSSYEGTSILNSFRKRDKSIVRRIYRLELKPNQTEFQVRSFIDRNFINIVRKKMEQTLNKRVAVEDTRISIVQLLSQDKKDFYNNKVTALISFGLGAYQYNVRMNVVNGEYDLKPMFDVKETLLGNSHYNYFVLDNKTNKYSQDAFVNFSTKKLITITGIQNGGIHSVMPYMLKTKGDVISGFVALFSKNNKTEAIIEQVDSLNLLSMENGIISSTQTPIQKFSFLPGQMMTESFYPVVVKDKKTGDLEGGLFIDNTQISSNQIYLKTLVNKKFIAPIRSSFFVTDNCKSKNPVQGRDGSFMFSFLCQDENGFRLKYINMIK